jgi:hypothetical protein
MSPTFPRRVSLLGLGGRGRAAGIPVLNLSVALRKPRQENPEDQGSD